ncbi:MAG: head GIN domain-containing protein [Bacteroidales bacterium]
MKTKSMTVIFGFILITGLLLSEANAHVFSNDKKENREVSAFSKISMSVSGDLYLTQGDEYKLEIEGDEDLLDDIETTVKNGRLKIKHNKPFRFSWNNKKVKIYVTTKEVEELSLSGSGNIIARTPISTEDVQFNVSGSGEIKIDELEAANINASISGSGDIRLAGRNSGGSLDISISGSGELHASDLRLRRAEISISGSGSCDVHVTENLEADVSGSGKVRYNGNPVIDADISGSGKVVKD